MWDIITNSVSAVWNGVGYTILFIVVVNLMFLGGSI